MSAWPTASSTRDRAKAATNGMADLHDLHEAGGVSIQSVDGSDVEDVVVEHVTIRNSRGAISVRRGARGRGQAEPRPGVVRDVVFRDIDDRRCA